MSESDITNITQELLELGISVHGYESSMSPDRLKEKINKLINSMKLLQQSAESVTESLPIDVIAYVEDGRNPDIYTREFVEILKKQNQNLNGQMSAITYFKQQLKDDLLAEFPELSEAIA